MRRDQIGMSLRQEMQNKQKTIRGLAREAGMAYPVIHRILAGNNFTIDNLMRVLDALDLEIEFKEKQ